MDTPTLPLNRRDRRALRYHPTAPTTTVVTQAVTKANEIAQTPVVIVAAGSHHPADPYAPRAGRRRVARAKAAGRMATDPCCEIDFLPLADQRRLMNEHDRSVERTGRYHGAGCHFCS